MSIYCQCGERNGVEFIALGPLTYLFFFYSSTEQSGGSRIFWEKIGSHVQTVPVRVDDGSFTEVPAKILVMAKSL